tara:strand:- start:522 stop:1106 length:585 start_codon:yes stop_codon:yes gene_type:complete
MNKRVSIDIVKNVLLPGLLIGSYMGLYFNLFYFSKSLLKMGGMLSYVVPIIVIAMIGIIMYLLNDKNNQKYIYLIAIPFILIIVLHLSAIFIGLLPLELWMLFPSMYLYPFALATIITIELLKGYYEPYRSHLIGVSIPTLVYPLCFPYLVASLTNYEPDTYYFMAPLHCALASLLYSLPFALYYYKEELNKKH